VIAAWQYEGAARSLILALKMRGMRAAAGPLACGLVDALGRAGTGASAVAWVPGRRRDVALRGFDHAEVLARTVAAHLGLPARSLVVRAADTPDQSTLTSVERAANVVGAFAAAPFDEPVLVIDDLLTTGATAGACAAALVASGTPAVEVGVACRA
jgi:predicted amidophosphoribosyltransferase